MDPLLKQKRNTLYLLHRIIELASTADSVYSEDVATPGVGFEDVKHLKMIEFPLKTDNPVTVTLDEQRQILKHLDEIHIISNGAAPLSHDPNFLKLQVYDLVVDKNHADRHFIDLSRELEKKKVDLSFIEDVDKKIPLRDRFGCLSLVGDTILFNDEVWRDLDDYLKSILYFLIKHEALSLSDLTYKYYKGRQLPENGMVNVQKYINKIKKELRTGNADVTVVKRKYLDRENKLCLHYLLERIIRK